MPCRYFRLLLLLVTAGALLPCTAAAQEPTRSCTGIVLSKSSLAPLAGATVYNRQRGTVQGADDDGRFALSVSPGDSLLITHVGYSALALVVPATAPGGIWTAIATLPERATGLPGITVGNRPTAAQFGRDFLKAPVRPDSIRGAMQGLSPADLALLRRTVPPSGSESVSAQMQARAQAATYAGQLPPMQVFNVFAWKRLLKKKKSPKTKSKGLK